MGRIHAFCLDSPPLEYIPTITPRSTYIYVGRIIDVYNDKYVVQLTIVAAQFVFKMRVSMISHYNIRESFDEINKISLNLLSK